MNLQLRARQFLKRNFSRIPLFCSLINCTFDNHKNALGEFTSTLIFSFLPLLIAYLVSYFKNHDTQFWSSIVLNVRNGELFLYVTSLLAPVFYIVMRKRAERTVFPNKAIHILLYFAIVFIAAIVFALKRAGFTFDVISLSSMQYLIFILALILFYLVIVYNNSLLPNPAATIRDEEDEFTDSLTEHRRAQ